jgi:2'-5' RNA ligase
MMETPGLLRSFIAVPLPITLQTKLASSAAELARDLPGVKWSRKPENLHVTLKFLGDVAIDRLETLGAALREALAEVPPFALALSGVDAFPDAGEARVIFVKTTDEPDRLAELAGLVETVSAQVGLPRETRPFKGHVTLGRSKEGVNARTALSSWTDRAFGAVAVDEVHIYESRLAAKTGEGSTYVLRHRAPLGARAN